MPLQKLAQQYNGIRRRTYTAMVSIWRQINNNQVYLIGVDSHIVVVVFVHIIHCVLVMFTPLHVVEQGKDDSVHALICLLKTIHELASLWQLRRNNRKHSIIAFIAKFVSDRDQKYFNDETQWREGLRGNNCSFIAKWREFTRSFIHHFLNDHLKNDKWSFKKWSCTRA